MKANEFDNMIVYDFSNLNLHQYGSNNCYGGGCDRVKCDNFCNCDCDCDCDDCKGCDCNCDCNKSDT